MLHVKRVAIEASTHFQGAIDNIVQILGSRIEERCAAKISKHSDEYSIFLEMGAEKRGDGFSLHQTSRATHIVGESLAGLLCGVGKFLRSSNYGSEGFSPSEWSGTSRPDCEFRGVDIEAHAHNWYQVAPEDEIQRYVEDSALWGTNVVSSVFPFLNLGGWDDHETEAALGQVRRIFKKAKDIGLKTCILAAPNSQFNSSPENLRASALPEETRRARAFFNGTNVCPSIPEAKSLILANFRRLFEAFADIGLDYFCSWPYDEGGCGCSRCYPWGGKGYLEISREVANLSRQCFRDSKFILSAWMFDQTDSRDWQGLERVLEEDHSWFDYLMVDSNEEYPDYPIEHRMFERVPMLNFPEITMWGMYPWGGFGANPTPKRLQSRWERTRDFLSGGFTYSEGIFDDMNKVLFSQFYWNKKNGADEILKEYATYHICSGKHTEILRIVDGLETVHTNNYLDRCIDKECVQQTRDIAESVNNDLPPSIRMSWRWRILYLRAMLDGERFVHNTVTSDPAKLALRELIQIYHARLVDDCTDRYHYWVRPPLPEGTCASSEEYWMVLRKKKRW